MTTPMDTFPATSFRRVSASWLFFDQRRHFLFLLAEILLAAIKGNAHVVVTFRNCLKRLRRKPVLAVLANRENLALGAEEWGLNPASGGDVSIVSRKTPFFCFWKRLN